METCMSIYTKNTFINIVKWTTMVDNVIWSIIMLYVTTYSFQHITQSERAIVRIIESLIAVATMGSLGKQWILDFVSKPRITVAVQLVSGISAAVIRWIVILSPVLYMILQELRCKCCNVIIFKVQQRYENRIFHGDELTQFTTIRATYNNIGALIGACILAVIGDDISIELVCWVAMGMIVVSYPYEIWLMFYVRKMAHLYGEA